MHEKLLFGIIGVLLFSITGLGTYEAVKHPVDAISLAPEAVSVVKEAAFDATNSVAQVLGATPTESAQLSSSGGESVSGRSDRENEVENENENENENEHGSESESDDDSRSATVTQVAPKPTPAPVQSTTPATGAKTFTMAQIATHNTAASCYSAISGSVYDLTSFISQHPGGQSAIKSLCGRDGSAAFDGQHGGQRRPANELASLKIGTLAQ